MEKHVGMFRRVLPQLLALVTGHARYLPDIRWSRHSWTHNVFRVYELIFWRRYGIRIENSSMRYRDKQGNLVTKYQIYTFEALCAHIETFIRQALQIKWLRVEVKQLQFAIPNQELRIPFISFAIAYDTATNGGSTAAASSDSWSHTVTGSDPLVVGGSAVRDTTAGDRNATAFTYNSVSLSEIRADDNGVDSKTEIWQLAGPATGAHTAAITWGGIITVGCGMMVSLTGVDQSSPNDANNGTTGTSATASVSITTVADNAWIVDVMYTQESASSDITAGGTASHTERQEVDLGASDNACIGTAGPISPAGATTVSWTWVGSEIWTISAASFKSGSSNITVNPSVLAATFSLPTRSINYDYAVSVSAQSATFSTAAPSVGVFVTIAASLLSAAFSLGTVSLIYDMIFAVNVLTATFSIPAVSLIRDMIFSVSVQVATFSTIASTIALDYVTTASVLSALFSAQSPTVIGDAAIAVSVLTAVFSIPLATIVTESANTVKNYYTGGISAAKRMLRGIGF